MGVGIICWFIPKVVAVAGAMTGQSQKLFPGFHTLSSTVFVKCVGRELDEK